MKGQTLKEEFEAAMLGSSGACKSKLLNRLLQKQHRQQRIAAGTENEMMVRR